MHRLIMCGVCYVQVVDLNLLDITLRSRFLPLFISVNQSIYKFSEQNIAIIIATIQVKVPNQLSFALIRLTALESKFRTFGDLLNRQICNQ